MLICDRDMEPLGHNLGVMARVMVASLGVGRAARSKRQRLDEARHTPLSKAREINDSLFP